jgi:rod shape-determining protein MreC
VSERGARWLLVLLLAGELILLTRQAAHRSREVPVLQGAEVRFLGPVARTIWKVGDSFSSMGEGMRSRKRVLAENEQLRREVDGLRRQVLRLQSVEGAFLRLGQAVEYSRRTQVPVQLADVVYADYQSWLRSLVLYAGDAKARVNQPVVADRGLVGRVVAVGGNYAKVQLVTDRASAVGAMIERSGRQGVVRGDGHSALELDYVPLQADVHPGDRVVSAGIDGIYPRGIPIGIVKSVSPGTQLFHHIVVVPLVDFGTVDSVYLLSALPEPQALSESLSRDLR